MKNKKTILFVIAAVLCLVLTGCMDKKLTLTSNDWEYIDGGFVYHFNTNGTGSYTVGESNVLNFAYTSTSKAITILYEGDTIPMTLNYRIEGNKLIVEDSFGEDVVYEKK